MPCLPAADVCHSSTQHLCVCLFVCVSVCVCVWVCVWVFMAVFVSQAGNVLQWIRTCWPFYKNLLAHEVSQCFGKVKTVRKCSLLLWGHVSVSLRWYTLLQNHNEEETCFNITETSVFDNGFTSNLMTVELQYWRKKNISSKSFFFHEKKPVFCQTFEVRVQANRIISQMLSSQKSYDRCDSVLSCWRKKNRSVSRRNVKIYCCKKQFPHYNRMSYC